jgi:hypothetical protein
VDSPSHSGNLPRDQCEIGIDPRSRRDGQLGHTQEPLGIMPGWQIAQRVLAHQEEETRRAKALGEDLERIGRVRRSGAVDIDRTDLVGRRAGKREGEHRQPIAVLTDDLAGLVRRTSGRNPHDALQTQRRPQRIRDGEMTVVNRIKGSTEDPDAPWLPPTRHNAPADDFVATVASGKSERSRATTWSSTRIPRSCSTVTSISVPSGLDWITSTTGT